MPQRGILWSLDFLSHLRQNAHEEEETASRLLPGFLAYLSWMPAGMLAALDAVQFPKQLETAKGGKDDFFSP